jgi:hypothetical protein
VKLPSVPLIASRLFPNEIILAAPELVSPFWSAPAERSGDGALDFFAGFLCGFAPWREIYNTNK